MVRIPKAAPLTIAAALNESAAGPKIRADPAAINSPDRSAGDMSLDRFIVI
jgi:hypothetical protein